MAESNHKSNHDLLLDKADNSLTAQRGIDKTLFDNYILNEIKSLEDSGKQLISVNSVLIGVYIAFIMNNLILEAIRTILIAMPFSKYLVYIVLVPIISWSLSVLYCCRVLNPKIDNCEVLFDIGKSTSYLKNIIENKHGLLTRSYLFMGFGILVIVLITAFAFPYQLTGVSDNWKAKGDAFFAQGKYNESIEAYNKAIELSPNADVWNAKGDAFFAQGKYDESNKAYDMASRLKQIGPNKFPNLASSDFFIAADPIAHIVTKPSESSIQLSVQDTNSFIPYKYPIILFATLINSTSFPPGLHILFDPQGSSEGLPFKIDMNIIVDSKLHEGNYNVKITAIGGDGKERSCIFLLRVAPFQNLTEDLSPIMRNRANYSAEPKK
jgi:tetratricopeptide (TPR) repeat protein